MSGEQSNQKGKKLKQKSTSHKKEEPKEDSSVEMQDMFQAMIPLLGRIAFPPEQLQSIVMRNKRNPVDYVKAYNLCDGEHTMSEIAVAINVKPGTLSPILTDWKEQGIIYEVKGKNGRFYQRLYKLEVPKSSKKAKGATIEQELSEEPPIAPILGEEKIDQQ